MVCSLCTLSMKLAKRLLRLLICSFSCARLRDRLGSISRFRGARRLLLTDRDVSEAPRPCWCPLVPAYRELLLRETPLNPPWPGPNPLSLLEALLTRTELLELIRLDRLRLMVEQEKDGEAKRPTGKWRMEKWKTWKMAWRGRGGCKDIDANISTKVPWKTSWTEQTMKDRSKRSETGECRTTMRSLRCLMPF